MTYKMIYINKEATKAVINRYNNDAMISTTKYNLTDKQARRLFNAVYWFVSKPASQGWTQYNSREERLLL